MSATTSSTPHSQDLSLPELARTFMPDLLLSLPPQKSNQTLLLSKLSSSSSIVGTCRTCRNLQEHAGACITCRNLRNLPEPAGTCGTCRNLPELCRHSRNFWAMVICFTLPWPPCVAFASTLTYHVGHNLQHPPQPGPFLAGTCQNLSELLCRIFY